MVKLINVNAKLLLLQNRIRPWGSSNFSTTKPNLVSMLLIVPIVVVHSVYYDCADRDVRKQH